MDGYVVIGTDLETKKFDAQIEYVKSQLQEIEDKIKNADMGFEVGDTKKLEAQYEKLSQKLSELIKKKKQFDNTSLASIQSSIKGVGNSVEGITKKVSRWALAVFGVRSAYMFVRQAVSTLSEYDDQMAVNIEWIRYLLASTLKPVIENLIQLAYKLLVYVGYLAKAWFNVDLFANASTEAFEKNQRSVEKTSKKAKELQKTLTGFDEMNVLQETGKVSSGGGGGGVTLPNFPKMEDVEIPGWIKWIKDNGGTIAAIIAGIVGALTALRLGLGGLKALGIGVAITGIVMAIQAFLDYLKDPSWENFGRILTGIGIAVAGVAIAFGAWPVAIAGALIAVYGIVVSNWNKIKDTLQGGIDWLKGLGEGIRKIFGDEIANIYLIFVDNLQQIFNIFSAQIEAAKKIFDGWIKFFKGVFTGDWKMAWEGIKQVFLGIIEGAVKTAIGMFNLIANSIKVTWNGLVYFFKAIISGIIELFKFLGTTAGNVLAGAFKAVINGVLWAIENILNTPIRAINGLINIINAIPGINLRRLSEFRLPRLAKGGIINMPGKGVPVGSAIAGERGAEGVIPLTDSQQMDLLGQAIGKYVSLNATIPVYVGNRQIAREIKRIDNESDFAFNR